MWAARKTLLFLQKTQHNQSQPLPFPDDEIIILLSEIWSWIFRLPMYILHMNKTMFWAPGVYSVQTWWLWRSIAIPEQKNVPRYVDSLSLLKIQTILSSSEGQNDEINVNFKNNQ